MIHPALSPIPCWGKLTIWIILFPVALIPHRGWTPIWLPNTAIATISYRGWIPIWHPNLSGCLPLLPNQTLTLLPLFPSLYSLLVLYPRRIWLPIWRLIIIPHWGWLPLWLIHTSLSTIPRWGKLPKRLLLFSVALMPYRLLLSMLLPNTSIAPIF